MTARFKTQIAEGNFTQGGTREKGEAVRGAVTDWAGSVKEIARTRLTVSGQKADAYVRRHPGRFIAGACCLGLAAGWVLGRTLGPKRG